MKKDSEKPLYWMGSSKEDLKKFPEEVKDVMGYSLHVAQNGGKADNAKLLSNVVKGGRVYEVVDDFNKDTYRAVYTVKFEKAVYVLHSFKKKSTKGISTPKPDVDLMKARYKAAESDYKKRYGAASKRGKK